jgi:hypothetical protein
MKVSQSPLFQRRGGAGFASRGHETPGNAVFQSGSSPKSSGRIVVVSWLFLFHYLLAPAWHATVRYGGRFWWRPPRGTRPNAACDRRFGASPNVFSPTLRAAARYAFTRCNSRSRTEVTRARSRRGSAANPRKNGTSGRNATSLFSRARKI